MLLMLCIIAIDSVHMSGACVVLSDSAFTNAGSRTRLSITARILTMARLPV
jgi:hypothetical protein